MAVSGHESTILVTAKLDESNSISTINNQIKKLSSKLEKVNLDVAINQINEKNAENSVTQTISKLQSKADSIPIKLSSDFTEIRATADDAAAQIAKMVQKMNSNLGQVQKVTVTGLDANGLTDFSNGSKAYVTLANGAGEYSKVLIQVVEEEVEQGKTIEWVDAKLLQVATDYSQIEKAAQKATSDMEKQTKSLTNSYQSLSSKITDLTIKSQNIKQPVMETTSTVSYYNEFIAKYNEIIKLQQQYEDYKNSDESKTPQGLNTQSEKLQEIKTLISECTTSYKLYNNEVNKINNQANIGVVSTDSSKLEQQNQQFDILNANIKKAQTRVASLSTTWSKLKTNTTLAAELDELIAKSKELKTSGDLKSFNAQLGEFEQKCRSAGVATGNFGDNLKRAFSNFAYFFSASRLIYSAISGIKQMVTNVTELDTAMVELRKVTEETDSTYDKFLDNATAKASEIGTSLTDYVNAVSDFARTGSDIDESETLAQVATMYKNVGDDLDDISDASSTIISTMKAFNITAEDSESIVDKLNKVSNEFAVSSGDLGDGLSNSASAMAVAGNSLDETIALLTAGTEITQNADEMGNSIKVLSMRLRGMKGQLEELGEEVDENVESISKMQTQILNLTNGSVNIFNDDGSFKSTYEIMKEIAAVYDDLSDTNQAALLETIAGKLRANQIASIITNFSQAESALSASLNSTGSAAEEQEKYLDSVEGKTAQFKASWQELSNSIVSSDLVKGVVDSGTGLLGLLTAINENLSFTDSGLAQIATSAGLSYLMGQDKGIFRRYIDSNSGESRVGLFTSAKKSNNENIIKNAKDAFQSYSDQAEVLDKNLEAVKNSEFDKWLGTVDKSLLQGVTTSTSYSEAINLINSNANALKDSKSIGAGLSSEELAQINTQVEVATANFGKYSTSVEALNGQLDVDKQKAYKEAMRYCNEETLKGVSYADKAEDAGNKIENNVEGNTKSFKGLGSVVKSVGATLGNFALSFAVSEVLSLAISAIDNYINRFEDRAAEMEEIADSWTEKADTLNSNKATVSEIKDEYAELADGVDSYGNNISLTSDEYDRYLELSNEIADMYPSLVKGYDEQGNAILSIMNNVNALTEALEKEQDAYYATILQDSGESWEDAVKTLVTDKGYFSDTTNYDDQIETINALRDAISEAAEAGEGLDFNELARKSGGSLLGSNIKKILEQSGAWDAMGLQDWLVSTSGLDAVNSIGVTNEELSELDRYLVSYAETAQTEIESIVTENMQPILETYIKYNNDSYDELSNEAQTAIDNVFGTLDWNNFYKAILTDDDATADEMLAEAEERIQKIIDVFSDDKYGEEIESAWTKLSEAQERYLSDSISEKQFMSVYQNFKDLMDEAGVDWGTQSYFIDLVVDNIEVADDVSPGEAIENILNRVDTSVKVDVDVDPATIGDINSEIDALGDYDQGMRDNSEAFEEYLSSLSHSTLQTLYEDTSIANMSLDELKDRVAEIEEEQAISASFDVETDDAVSSLESLISAFDNVQTAITEYSESGSLSFDNLKALLDLDDVYLNMLINEQGELDLTAESYRDLAKAQLEQLKASYLQEAIDTVNDLETEADATAYLASCQEAAASTALDYADAKWEEAMAAAAVKDVEQGTGTLYQDTVQAAQTAWTKRAALIDSYAESLSDLSTSTEEVTTATEKQQEALEDEIDALEDEQDALEDEKEALEDEKEALEDAKEALEEKQEALEDEQDALEDAKSAIEDYIDWVEKYIEQIKEDEIDALEKEQEALEEQKDTLDDLIDARRELLEAEKEEYDWNQEISDQQNTVAKNALAAAAAELDDSSAGRKASKAAQDTLNESRSDMKNSLVDHEYEIRSDALDELQDEIDEVYDNNIDDIDEAIDKIQDYLDDEVQIYRDACAMIDNDNGTLYNKLLNYCLTYTTTGEAEFNHMWNSAQAAMEQYNVANLSTYNLMNYLQQKIYDIDYEISVLADQISNYDDKIDSVSDSIDGVSDSIDILSDRISTLQDKVNDLGDSAETTVSKIKALNDLEISGVDAKWSYTAYGKTYYSSQSERDLAAEDITAQISADSSVGNIDMPPQSIYNVMQKLATGTKSAKGGLTIVDEEGIGSELIPTALGSGRYTILPEGNPVFSKSMTNELFDFASNPSDYLTGLMSDIGDGIVTDGITNNMQSISPTFNMTITGDATQATVKALQQQGNKIVDEAVKKMMTIALNNKRMI